MARLLAGAVALSERDPLSLIDWLPGQEDYLRAKEHAVLLRSGNQWLGKTTAGIADFIWWARGEHPYRAAATKPVHGWIVSSSEQQSGGLASKFDALCPPAWLHPDSLFEPSKGHYRGKYPRVGIRHVSGGWSWLYFRWTGQRTLNLASATLDGVWFDEPPSSQRAFREVERRLTRTGGDLRLTFTPVNAPVDYIRDMVDEGAIRDIHYPLKPENLVPRGLTEPIRAQDGRPMDEDWINEQRQMVMGWEGAVVLDGEWEFRGTGSVFTAWDPTLHVSNGPILADSRVPEELTLSLGIDYGDDEHRQVATLIGVDDTGEHPRVYVLDAYMSGGKTTDDMDAAEIMAMLRRNGFRWMDLECAFGDKRYAGKRGGITTKSNKGMQAEIGKLIGIPFGRMSPQIIGAKEGQGAGAGIVHRGARWLHEAMVRPDHFLVDPKCVPIIEAIGRWDWGERYKDPIDSLRYACKPWILNRRRLAKPIAIRVA